MLLWADSLRTVPAVCSGPPCQEMAQFHAATKILASAWNSTNFCQITIISNSAYKCPITEPKKTYMITAAVQYQLSYSRPPNERESSRSATAASNCPKEERVYGGGSSPRHLSTCLGCRCAGSLRLNAWWHPYHLLFQCLFLLLYLSLCRSKLGGDW